MTAAQVLIALGIAIAGQLGAVIALCWYVRRDNDRVVSAITDQAAAHTTAAIAEHAEDCQARMRERSDRFRRA